MQISALLMEMVSFVFKMAIDSEFLTQRVQNQSNFITAATCILDTDNHTFRVYFRLLFVEITSKHRKYSTLLQNWKRTPPESPNPLQFCYKVEYQNSIRVFFVYRISDIIGTGDVTYQHRHPKSLKNISGAATHSEHVCVVKIPEKTIYPWLYQFKSSCYVQYTLHNTLDCNKIGVVWYRIKIVGAERGTLNFPVTKSNHNRITITGL